MVEKVRYYCFKLLADPTDTVRIRADRAEEQPAPRQGAPTVKLYIDDECVGKMRNVDSWWVEDQETTA